MVVMRAGELLAFGGTRRYAPRDAGTQTPSCWRAGRPSRDMGLGGPPPSWLVIGSLTISFWRKRVSLSCSPSLC